MNPRKIYFLVILSFCSCNYFDSSLNRYQLTVRYQGPAASPVLEDLKVIIGSDKFWWPTLIPGEPESVTLYSEVTGKNQLDISFTIDGEKRLWQSHVYDQGADYKIEVTLAPDRMIRVVTEKRP